MQSNHSRSSRSFGNFAEPRAAVEGMRLVVLESPFAGDVEANIAYAKRAIHDCLMRAEAPIASHLLFTQPGVLDDDVPGERALGIEAGLSWYRVAQACVAYVDRGISVGMRLGMERARAAGISVDVRRIGE